MKLLGTFFNDHCLYHVYCSREYNSCGNHVLLLWQGFGDSSSINKIILLDANFIKLSAEEFFGLVFISECFISRCTCLFGIVLSAAKIVRHGTLWGFSSLLIITLMKLKDKYDLSCLCNFSFYMQLWLLFAVYLSSFFIPIEDLCIILWFSKHHLLVFNAGL
jgi:hypothetical protein